MNLLFKLLSVGSCCFISVAIIGCSATMAIASNASYILNIGSNNIWTNNQVLYPADDELTGSARFILNETNHNCTNPKLSVSVINLHRVFSISINDKVIDNSCNAGVEQLILSIQSGDTYLPVFSNCTNSTLYSIPNDYFIGEWPNRFLDINVTAIQDLWLYYPCILAEDWISCDPLSIFNTYDFIAKINIACDVNNTNQNTKSSNNYNASSNLSSKLSYFEFCLNFICCNCRIAQNF